MCHRWSTLPAFAPKIPSSWDPCGTRCADNINCCCHHHHTEAFVIGVSLPTDSSPATGLFDLDAAVGSGDPLPLVGRLPVPLPLLPPPLLLTTPLVGALLAFVSGDCLVGLLGLVLLAAAPSPRPGFLPRPPVCRRPPVPRPPVAVLLGDVRLGWSSSSSDSS